MATSTPLTFSNTTVTPLVAGSTVTSSLTIPTSFLVQGLTVALDITYPNDPDLEVFLTAPDGTTIELIKNAGAANGANFSGTILVDSASTSIQNVECAVHRPVPSAATPEHVQRQERRRHLDALDHGRRLDRATGAGMLNSWSLTVQPPSSGRAAAGDEHVQRADQQGP